jgi:hypothetical protein
MYVTASTPSLYFRAALDRSGLRMMAVDMPSSLSFGSILAGLGVSDAALLGDMISVAATTVVFVPTVNGSGAHARAAGGRTPAVDAEACAVLTTDVRRWPACACLSER